MSLAGRVNTLATRIATEIKAVRAATVPKTFTSTSDASGNGFVGSWTVAYVTGGGSPTMMDAWYNPAGIAYHTFWLNENGSPRAAMGKASDSAAKFIGWGSGQNGNTVEFQRYSGSGVGSRTNDAAIGPDGKWRTGSTDVTCYMVVVIAAGATAPPAGTPIGTPVLRLRA